MAMPRESRPDIRDIDGKPPGTRPSAHDRKAEKANPPAPPFEHPSKMDVKSNGQHASSAGKSKKLEKAGGGSKRAKGPVE
jgi:hypothetical protein